MTMSPKHRHPITVSDEQLSQRCARGRVVVVDDDDEISIIKSDAKINSLELISSEKEAKYVLEINAGLAKEFGMEARQKVQILN